MMGIGFTEMLVIGVLILLLFGPEKIPTVAKTLAKVYREVRTTGSEFTRAIRTEMDAVTGETRDELRQAQTDLTAAASGLLAGRFGETPAKPQAALPAGSGIYTGRPTATAAQAPVPPEWLELIEVPYTRDVASPPEITARD
jgi:sec-independent protein translocase protein TatB